MLLLKSNLVIVVVTYNPDEILSHSIDFYLKISKRVIIVDNNSELSSLAILQMIEKFDNIEIVYSKQNRGIAWGLNVGVCRALEYSPQWIITFDQDSIPALNILDVYNEVLLHHSEPERIGILSGGFSLISDNAVFPIQWKESLVLITSGMLHNVKIFDKIGFYNEKLFIDSVDFEFVMRVHSAGFSTVRIQNDIIKHKIGSPIRRKICGKNFESSNHNAIRRYYQGRNLVYITRKFIKQYPAQILNYNYYFFCKIIPRMIFLERSLKVKVRFLIKGLWDGLFFD